MVMNRADPDWATITSYEDLPGGPQPMAATRAWLRERGIDWMPLSDNEIRCNLACGQFLMVDGMAGPASRSAPMRFADSVCIQTNPPRSLAGRRLRPGGMLPQNAKYDARCPCGTRPVHRDGILTRAAVLKQGPRSLGRRGPMMTRRSAE
jgi:hypothetical protein